MRKRLAVLAIGGLAVLGLAGCGPQGAINEIFGPVAHQATRIAECESGMNPNAVSPGGGNHGLFQINSVHRGLVESMGYSWGQIYDPYVNTRVAKVLYDRSGWQPWSCRRVL